MDYVQRYRIKTNNFQLRRMTSISPIITLRSPVGIEITVTNTGRAIPKEST